MGEENVSINLPQIVVVGSQSAGKSSVLESIVGREFLPRGDGICTRRPLILQLYHNAAVSNQGSSFPGSLQTSVSSNSLTEWAEFLHKPGEKFTDFDLVRQEIVEETSRLSGNNAGISSVPIRLRLFSPNVLTLTLIDLPGITRNPIGDQPDDIEEQVRDLCEKFCNNSRTLILAVTAANTDIANSDGLSVARKCDPKGERTLGVITKLDLMDEGTDASSILNNQLIPLKLGYIGVVNRSQLEINSRTSVEHARKKEHDFFKSHPNYDEKRNGTVYLTKQLNKVLYKHIRLSLPSLRNEVNSRVLQVDNQLKNLGLSPLDVFQQTKHSRRIELEEIGDTRMSEAMLNMITEYAKKYSNAIEGKFDIEEEVFSESPRMKGNSGISGGAKILSLFHGTFHRELQAISPLHNISDEQLKRTILSTMGTKKALFVPENSFELLVSRQIGYFLTPSLQCAQRVFEELAALARKTHASHLQRFPSLQDKVIEVVVELLKKQLEPTKRMIEDIISIEKAYINTSHPDFVGGPAAIKNAYNNTNSRQDIPQPLHDEADVSHTTEEPVSLGIDADDIDIVAPPAPNQDKSILSFLFNKNDTGTSGLQHKRGTYDSLQELTNDNGSLRSIQEEVAEVSVPPLISSTSYEGQALNEMDCEIIKELMKSYLEVTRKNVEDLVPKTIMFYLVNFIKDNVQNALVREVYNNRNEYNVYLKEDPEIAEKRKRLKVMKKHLLKALDVLSQVDDLRLQS